MIRNSLLTIFMLMITVSLLGQVDKSADSLTASRYNTLANTSKFTFITTDDYYGLDIRVHGIEWEYQYYQNNIWPLLKNDEAKLTDLGYIYVKVRFDNGKYFYGLDE